MTINPINKITASAKKRAFRMILTTKMPKKSVTNIKRNAANDKINLI